MDVVVLHADCVLMNCLYGDVETQDWIFSSTVRIVVGIFIYVKKISSCNPVCKIGTKERISNSLILT